MLKKKANHIDLLNDESIDLLNDESIDLLNDESIDLLNDEINGNAKNEFSGYSDEVTSTKIDTVKSVLTDKSTDDSAALSQLNSIEDTDLFNNMLDFATAPADIRTAEVNKIMRIANRNINNQIENDTQKVGWYQEMTDEEWQEEQNKQSNIFPTTKNFGDKTPKIGDKTPVIQMAKQPEKQSKDPTRKNAHRVGVTREQDQNNIKNCMNIVIQFLSIVGLADIYLLTKLTGVAENTLRNRLKNDCNFTTFKPRKTPRLLYQLKGKDYNNSNWRHNLLIAYKVLEYQLDGYNVITDKMILSSKAKKYGIEEIVNYQLYCDIKNKRVDRNTRNRQGSEYLWTMYSNFGKDYIIPDFIAFKCENGKIINTIIGEVELEYGKSDAKTRKKLEIYLYESTLYNTVIYFCEEKTLADKICEIAGEVGIDSKKLEVKYNTFKTGGK